MMPAHATRTLGPDKLLAIGAFGETVAAYRYVVLAEKAPREEDRREFAAMADEEQDHKQRLQSLVAELYPDSDFMLTPDDKELVVTGTRLLDLRDEAAFRDALRMILDTERKTAAFYAAHGAEFDQPHLRALFQELADEGDEHFKRLCDLARRYGVDPD